jgi:hypothetical protein
MHIDTLIEGSRQFEIWFGIVTGTTCFLLGLPLVVWWVPRYRRSFFGTRIDPTYALQLVYGAFCFAMFGTNVICRAVPHDDLAYVHPTYFAITLLLVFGLGPRVVYLLVKRPRAVRGLSAG